MAYICLVSFNDKETQTHYEAGDMFNPQSASDKRMAELLSPFNELGAPVIRFVEDETADEKPKAKGKGKKVADGDE